MAERWSNSLTIQFVEQYRCHPCLWDVENHEYKNKQARDAALQDIVDKLQLEGFTVAAAKKKLRVIRSSYWNEQSKILKSKKSGAGADSVYRPKVAWFPVADEFLKKVTTWRWSDTDLVVPKTETDLGNSEELNMEEFLTNTYEISESQSPLQHSDLPPSRPSSQLSRRSSNPTPAKRKKVESLDDAVKTIKELSNSLLAENEFDSFAKNIASQLKTLPLADALELQMQIQTLIGRRRIMLIRGSSSEHTSNSSWIIPSPPSSTGPTEFHIHMHK